MFPLVPTLALTFLSFISSAFVILRIIVPILPPHPLSKRVPPSEFGLPNFRSLSAADKSHVWLASLDLLALAVFVWEAVNESLGGPADSLDALDAGSAARIWFSLTIRQTCLLVVASLTLLHVRMGRSVSFGARHWMLWTPTLLITVTSTTLAAVIAVAKVPTFFPGLVAFNSSIAVLSSVVFACLIGTLVIIRANLAALSDPVDSWPPLRQMEEKGRPSFATEDIDALREGSSWITSDNGSSRHDSISTWSFSTHHTVHRGSVRNPATASNPSIPAKSSFWFNPATPHGVRDTSVPPVPPLPSPYRPHLPTAASLADDPDPFRRDLPGQSARSRMGSQTSWLTSPSASQVTLSAWSYPTTQNQDVAVTPGASTTDVRADLLSSARPATPAMANAQVLGGYGYTPAPHDTEKGLTSLAAQGNEVDVSVYRAVGWLITIWVPLALSLPYLFTAGHNSSNTTTSILLILSVTLSSPLLALNILFRSPIPIPTGLFDVHNDPPSVVIRAPSPQHSLASYEYKYKRSGSVTIVEGRRSGDVWVSNGDAVDGKNKLSRTIGMLSPAPRLAVLPLPDGEPEDGEVTPPLPLQMEETPIPSIAPTPQSQTSEELGRRRKESKTSSSYSGAEESLGYASRIMVAQRHYSTLAQTLLVPASPEKCESVAGEVLEAAATGADIGPSLQTAGRPSHLRSRSVSTLSGPRSPTMGSFSISPPPSFPLPPTPPSLKARRMVKLAHKKSFSSGFSFGAVGNDDINEIDALTAGVLPLLVPGLKVGPEMKIRGSWNATLPSSSGNSTGKKSTKGKLSPELGGLSRSGDFSSPEAHSTPAQKRLLKQSAIRKKHHFSLPSLGLGKDGIRSLASEIDLALKARPAMPVPHFATLPNASNNTRRNTVWGGKSVQNARAALTSNAAHDDDLLRPEGYPGVRSTRSRLQADVPTGVSTARSSVATLLSEVASAVNPPSAASTVTLFDFEGPQAESTPRNSLKDYQKTKHAPPPLPEPIMTQRPNNHRSSIVYKKSDDENKPPTPPQSSGRTSFAQWSSRAVRPLIPKSSILQRKPPSPAIKHGSPSGGLRPLSLLQDRDPNTMPASPGGTRPLALGKKQKNSNLKIQDENAGPSSKNRNLKPLQLVRSETSKVRGILRKDEVLPEVVVRPPSQTEHKGFAYSFR